MAQIFIGSDHAAVEMKETVKSLLSKFGLGTTKDLGTFGPESTHYPNFAKSVCQEVLKNPGSRGILLCGSGIGMSIVANKFQGIRAALCRTTEEAGLSREHNDANVLCLGARTTEKSVIEQIVKIWMETPFAGGRHQDRIDLFKDCGTPLKSS